MLNAEAHLFIRSFGLPSDLDTIHKGPDSLHTGSHTAHKDDHTIHKGSHTLHSNEILPEQWSNLEEIALPAKLNKRLAPNEMEAIILRLCKDQWLTRRQISDLVDRNSDGLRSRFLTPMVEHERLQLRFPDKPKRTDQAYRVARKQQTDTGNNQ